MWILIKINMYYESFSSLKQLQGVLQLYSHVSKKKLT